MRDVKPNSRMLTGMALIGLLILGWSVIVVSGADLLAGLPWPVHLLYYLVAGIGWVLPLRPLLRWMEAGRRQG